VGLSTIFKDHYTHRQKLLKFFRVLYALRACHEMNITFCISSSRHLRPIFNHKILEIVQDYYCGPVQSDRPNLT